jgi:hypothetical protein
MFRNSRSSAVVRRSLLGTAAAAASVGLVIASAPAYASVTAPSTVSDGLSYNVSGVAPAGATYAAIALCNQGATPGSACDGTAGSSTIVATSGGTPNTYPGSITVHDDFTNARFGTVPVTPGTTSCDNTGATGGDICEFQVSYYSGSFPAISHISGADEASTVTFN